MPLRILLLVVFFCACPRLNYAAVKPFLFRNETIKAGAKRAMLLPVVAGKDSTVIPVTIFHGIKPGPVLGVIAGVHGYEYPPIVATQQFAQSLNPAQLSGTVMVVHLANVPGFLGHRTDDNPLDNKNLNRVFPGKVDGTITERMAWLLGNDIMARCNYVVDVHAGDAPEDLRPYSGYYNYFDMPELSEKGRQMAVALGFPYVVQFGNEPTLKEEAIYCSREAIKRGIPAVDIECGRLGQVEAENVALIKQALHNLLVHLRIEKGTLPTNPLPYMIARRTSINSEHTGFFYPQVKAGEFIYQGRKLGYLTDLFGNYLADVVAPVNGVVLFMSSTPPINIGESLFSIGHVQLPVKP